VLLLSEPGRLVLYNKSAGDLKLWGAKMEGFAPALEKEPRIVPVDGFYYFLNDALKGVMLLTLGQNGEKLFPFETYIADGAGRRYVAKFALLIKMNDGSMQVHTQQLGVQEGDWSGPISDMALGPIVMAAPATQVPLGSLQYVQFIAEVGRAVSTKKTSVQMMLEVKNRNNFLLKYRVRMNGQVNGKTLPEPELQFDGYIGAGETRKLMYGRIDDVPANETPTLNKPTLAGVLNYEVVYWAAQFPEWKRRSVKTCAFEMKQPFSNKPKGPGEVVVSKLETTIHLSNEIEE